MPGRERSISASSSSTATRTCCCRARRKTSTARPRVPRRPRQAEAGRHRRRRDGDRRRKRPANRRRRRGSPRRSRCQARRRSARFSKSTPDQTALALSASDIVRIHKAGKIAVIESFLNTRSIGSDLAAIDRLLPRRRAAVRVQPCRQQRLRRFIPSERRARRRAPRPVAARQTGRREAEPPGRDHRHLAADAGRRAADARALEGAGHCQPLERAGARRQHADVERSRAGRHQSQRRRRARDAVQQLSAP